MKKKVLVLCHDTVGAKMAGPGIRYKNIAEQIERVADVTLAVFSDVEEKQSKSDIIRVNTQNDRYKALFDRYDVIFAQWLSSDMLHYAKTTGKVIVIDLYAPVPIEYLASLGFSDTAIGSQKDLEFTGILETYKQYLTLGDYFVCSNERQRDFWLGFMTSANILTPSSFVKTAKMDRVALCPMGISTTAPSNVTLQLRKRAGIAKDDFVLLWTGGIWDWFDAQVVIKALKKVDNPKVKLVFMGTQHPNSKVPEMSESKMVRRLAQKLNMTDKTVFFLDGWVDYDQRANYLLDADVAIYADKESVETRFSHRTRVLDHIWAGLPTISSKGDYLANVLAEGGMGVAVEERTPEAFAKAIQQCYENPTLLNTMRENIEKQRHKFTWRELSTNLIEFIKDCEPSQVDQPINVPARKLNKAQKAKRRVKGSVKVLLGKASV